jgi:hypothetical protein
MFAFAINVHRDEKLLKHCLRALKTQHPEATVLVIPDVPRLKVPKFGGLWTKRYLEKLVETGADHVFKLDPDMYFVAPIKELPDAEVFGRHWLFEDGTQQIVAECMGWTREGAQKMLDANLWEDEKYKKPEGHFAYERYPGEELVSVQDTIVMDIILKLGMTHAEWLAPILPQWAG